MNKTILIAFIIFIMTLQSTYALTDKVDLSQMSPKEVLQFYKDNPDYGKKRVDINYEEYIKGNYLVFRGEYLDIKGNPIQNRAINYNFNGKKYAYVTSEKGIFNLEVLKKDIKENTLYTIELTIDGYKIKTKIKGKELIEKSIYHFKITKEDGNPYKLQLETINNNSFIEGSNSFKQNAKIKKEPSVIGIQGMWLYILFGTLGLFIAFFYFDYRRKNNEISSNEDDIKIPEMLK